MNYASVVVFSTKVSAYAVALVVRHREPPLHVKVTTYSFFTIEVTSESGDFALCP